MTGVTIGIGDEYRFYAEEASKRFTHFTGLPVVILSKEHIEQFADEPIIQKGTTMAEKAYYLKFFMHEIVNDDICYFDCDYCVVDYWRPDKIFDGRFTAVRDRTNYLFKNDVVYCDIMRYVNAGFYMISKEYKSFFERCRSYGVEARTKFFDQCVLNICLQMEAKPINYLDRRYNCMNFDGALRDLDLKAIHNSSNYRHYKEGTTDKGSAIHEVDTIQMTGLEGLATLVFEDRKQKTVYLFADGTTSEGNLWFVNKQSHMFVCEDYIYNPVQIKELYQP